MTSLAYDPRNEVPAIALPAHRHAFVDLICSALVLLIPFSSFLGPSNSLYRLVLIAVTVMCIIALGIWRNVFASVKEVAPLAFVSGFLLIAQVLDFEGSRIFFNYHVGLIIGLHALVIDRKSFIRVATAFLILQSLAELYEYLTSTLIFNSISVGGDVFDEQVYRGNEGVFRAKGLADGPTSVGFFLLFLATMLRGRIIAMTLIMACCFFSSARLGLVVVGTMYVVDFYSHLKKQVIRPFWLIVYVIGILAILLVFLTRLLQQENADFILDALDMDNNDNNIARIEYINYGISYVSSMNVKELIFGSSFDLKNSGVVFESAWLGITAQAGAIMTGVYFWSVCHKSTQSWVEAHNRVAIIVASAVAGTFDPLGGSVLMFMALGQSWHRYDQKARYGRLAPARLQSVRPR